jgi:hypothetical protein
MTSFVNRIRQKIERERKHLTKKEISEKVEQDWLAYSEIEGIRKWLAEHPDLAEDLRKKRGELIKDRIKRDLNGK